jgi:hypothetical protein
MLYSTYWVRGNENRNELSKIFSHRFLSKCTMAFLEGL